MRANCSTLNQFFAVVHLRMPRPLSLKHREELLFVPECSDGAAAEVGDVQALLHPGLSLLIVPLSE